MKQFNDKWSNDLSEFNTISFEEMNQGFKGGQNPLDTIRTQKSFQEISNEIALNTPFGKNSKLYRELREIIIGKIPKL